jgi:outer membrane lipoprotein-sorting protein
MFARLLALSVVCGSVYADEMAPLKTALAKQAQHKTVSVAVRQTKRIPALSEQIVQTGHVWLQPGKAFRWELGKPVEQSAVFDGTRVYLMDETRRTATEMAPDDRRARPLLLMLGMGEGASFDGLHQAFTVAGTNRVREHFIVSLLPKGQLKRALDSMVMQVNTRTSFLERIEWTQRDGTVVITEFFPPVLNKPLSKGVFHIDRSRYAWE